MKTFHYFNYNSWLSDTLYYQLFQQFYENGKHFYCKEFSGLVENVEKFYEDLEQISGLKKVFEKISESDNNRYYLFDRHYLSVFDPFGGKVSIELLTDDKIFFDKISNFFNLKFKEKKDEQQIHMICPDEYSEKQSLYPMGVVSSELERSNYTDDVLEKIDFVIKELNSKNPVGRMVLVDGPSGTGKSYLIRGILKQLKFGKCVLVPVSMLEALDKPTLIPLLMKNRSERSYTSDDETKQTKPIILIIEDADDVLVPRAADNMSAISSLLNYTDGLFGSLFDIRIIATTNAQQMEIEKALLRPGRLLKRIHVDLLPPKKAEEIYFKLTGKNKNFDKHMSLASIYSFSKGVEEIDEEAEEGHQSTIGF